MVVECLAKSKGLLPVKINPILRKHGSVEEKGVVNMFDKEIDKSDNPSISAQYFDFCLMTVNIVKQMRVASFIFTQKGVIIAEMRKGTTLDDAESDAIEAGAEEVTLIDEETNTLEFVTQDIDLVQVKGALIKAGYKCEDATITYIPNVTASPNGIERKTLDKMVDVLMNEAIVTNVHTNVG